MQRTFVSDQMVFLSETIPANVAHKGTHLLVHDLVVLLKIVPPREPRLAHVAGERFFVRFADVYLALLHRTEPLGALCAGVRCAVTVVVVAIVRTVAGIFVALAIDGRHVVVAVLAWCTRLRVSRPNGRHVALMLHMGILI